MSRIPVTPVIRLEQPSRSYFAGVDSFSFKQTNKQKQPTTVSNMALLEEIWDTLKFFSTLLPV